MGFFAYTCDKISICVGVLIQMIGKSTIEILVTHNSHHPPPSRIHSIHLKSDWFIFFAPNSLFSEWYRQSFHSMRPIQSNISAFFPILFRSVFLFVWVCLCVSARVFLLSMPLPGDLKCLTHRSVEDMNSHRIYALMIEIHVKYVIDFRG